MIYIQLSLILVCALIGTLSDVKNNNTLKVIFISFMFISFIISSISAYHDHQEKIIESNVGIFNFPWNLDSKPLLYFGPDRRNTSTVILGDSEDKFETTLENGKIGLNATIRDSEGNRIFVIEGDTWTSYLTNEFNYDESAFEVKDSKGRIVFQLQFNQADGSMKIVGVVPLIKDEKVKGVILISEDGIKTTESIEEVYSFSRSIKPIFLYPRKLHFQERVRATP